MVIWFAYFPVFVCIGIPISFENDGFGIPMHIYAFVIMVCYVWVTVVYARIAVQRCRVLPESYKLTRLLLYGSLITVVCAAMLCNLIPHRIERFSSHSPFDRWWFDTPQIAFGIPSPYLRIFDELYFDKERPFIGKQLLDLPSLMSNITLWCFPIFIVVSMMYPLLPPTEMERTP